jgi:hypothetical protein
VGDSHDDNVLSLHATIKPYGIYGQRFPLFEEAKKITLDDYTPIEIRYRCEVIPKEYTHAVIELELSNGEAFQYVKQCHPTPHLFWTHFVQFLAIAKTAMWVLLVGSKMGKLSLFERIDEYRFDYYRIPVKNIIILILLACFGLVTTYLLLGFKWFNWFITINL